MSARHDQPAGVIAVPETGDEAKCADRTENLAGDLSAVFSVKNASLFIGELLEAEDTSRQVVFYVVAVNADATASSTSKR